MKLGEKLNQVKVSQLMSMIALSVLTHAAAMAQSSSTSTAAGTSTITADAVKPKVNKFGFTYANATSNSFYDTKTKGGGHAINVFSLSYAYSDAWKYALTMTNDYTIPAIGAKKDDNAVYRDAGLSASTTYGSFLGTEKTPVKYRLYLPTTKASQDIKQAFIANFEVALSYDLAEKLSATALFDPFIYVRNGDDQLRHYLETEIRYSYTPTFSNYIGFQHDIRGLAGKSFSETQETVAFLVGVGYSPTKNIDLQFSFERDRVLHESAAVKNESEAFSFLDEKEISYVAEATLKF